MRSSRSPENKIGVGLALILLQSFVEVRINHSVVEDDQRIKFSSY